MGSQPHNIRAEYLREGADRIRRLGNRTPWWTVTERDGQPVVVDGWTGALLLTIHGQWSVDLAQLFRAIDNETMRKVADMIWEISLGAHPVVVTAAADLVAWVSSDPRQRKTTLIEAHPPREGDHLDSR